MKKLSFLLLIFLALPAAASTLEKNIYIKAQTGITAGEIKEQLFHSVSSRLLSELIWEQKPAINFTLGTGLQVKNFGSEINFKYNLPSYCGQMTDSDWIIKDIKTNLGIFKNYTDYKNFSLNLDLHYDFTVLNTKSITLQLTPYTNTSYTHYSFYTNTGYGWYGNNCAWDEPEAIYHPKLSHIEYAQQIYSLYTGIKVSAIINKFKVNLEAAVSPLTINYMLDYHSDENPSGTADYSTYSKQITSFRAWTANLTLEYNLSPKVIATATTGILYKAPSYSITGDSPGRQQEPFAFTENPDTWHTRGQFSGNTMWTADFNLGLKFLF